MIKKIEDYHGLSRYEYETVYITISPFTLGAAKSGLMILEIFYLQQYFLENI